MKVLGIGEAVVDTISVVTAHPQGFPDTVVATHQDAGGPVLSALILLSKLGAECSMITSLGDDNGGRLIRDTLQDATITLIENTQLATKQHTVLVDAVTGERRKIRGAVQHTPLEGLDPSLLGSFDLIIMDRHERKAFYEVIRHANPSARIIVDPSTEVSDFTKDMMRHATCPIVPIEALAELGQGLTLEEALETLHRICNKPFVVTLGELGSLLYDNGTTHHVQPIAVPVADTNGAGDIFRGAFAYGQLQGWSLLRCTEYANTVAALQCTKPGNARAVPDRIAIEAQTAKAAFRELEPWVITAHFATLSTALTPTPQPLTA